MLAFRQRRCFIINRTIYIQNRTFSIFKKFFSFDFPEKKYEKRVIVILPFPFKFPNQAKLLAVGLLSKILSPDQIEAFLKAQYFKKALK